MTCRSTSENRCDISLDFNVIVEICHCIITVKSSSRCQKRSFWENHKRCFLVLVKCCEILSWGLYNIYPVKCTFWRWFSFSHGGRGPRACKRIRSFCPHQFSSFVYFMLGGNAQLTTCTCTPRSKASATFLPPKKALQSCWWFPVGRLYQTLKAQAQERKTKQKNSGKKKFENQAKKHLDCVVSRE